MQVIQLAGRYAGETIEMPYARARACIEAGTARPIPAEVPARASAPVAEPEFVPPPVVLLPAPQPRGRGRPRKNP